MWYLDQCKKEKYRNEQLIDGGRGGLYRFYRNQIIRWKKVVSYHNKRRGDSGGGWVSACVGNEKPKKKESRKVWEGTALNLHTNTGAFSRFSKGIKQGPWY